MATTNWTQTAGMVSEEDVDNIETFAEQAEAAKDAAAISEVNASASAAAAETAKAGAEAALDSFDDRYLGAKSSDPTLDNDGDALITGALYFNTISESMNVYDGSAWGDVKPTSAEQTNIDAVAADEADIGTVATNIADVNTVAGISADVTSVAGDATDIGTVAGISANVTTVAGISSYVTAVAGDEADIGTVATSISNVNTVAGISANVTTVAGNTSNINVVAGDAADIGTVATNIADVNTVAGISADVTTVAADGTDIGTVAGISANVTTVAGVSSNVTTVAGVSSNVTTVATNIASVNTNAANITEIQNAPANAATATTKAAEAAASATAAATSATAAAASQTAAANSAAAAASAFDNFDDTYLGSKTSDPTVDNDGDPLNDGDLYFNSTDNEMRVYDGSDWIAASSAGGASLLNYNYTATSGQTTFSGTDDNANTLAYTVDNIIVTLNGVVLEQSADYTATDGSSIVLTAAAALDDEVNVIAFKSFTTADMVSATNGGTFQGNVDFSAGIDVTGNIAVSGTVDGRDVASDGSKLDGVETGANVTDTANVTAAGALMDSEVTNLAQVKAFDSSDYATAAQGTLADSAIQSGDNVSALTNDAGYTTNVGDITGVTAGSGLSGGGTSGSVTLSHSDTSSQGSVNNSGNTVVQDITLDTYGHITNINSKTISTSASTSAGAVGTYAFLADTTAVSPGGTYAGSSLLWAGMAGGEGTSSNNLINTQGSPSGTWRAMGDSDFSGKNRYVTVFVRIS